MVNKNQLLRRLLVLVCLLLPAAVAGGEVSAAAPHAAYLALCLADPMAWFAADLVMRVEDGRAQYSLEFPKTPMKTKT